MLTKPRIFAICLVAACGLGGYAAGTRDAARQTEEQQPTRVTSSGKREQAVKTGPVPDFSSLVARHGRSPNLWKAVSRMSEDEVREAIARMPSSDVESMKELKAALFHHWAEMDPLAAVEAAGKIEDNLESRAMFQSALCAWMRTDPEAAYKAMKGHTRHDDIVSDLYVNTWSTDTVLANLKQADPRESRRLVAAFCSETVMDPKKRDFILKALESDPSFPHRNLAYQQLFRYWTYQDPEAAFTAAEKLSMPHLEKQMLDDALGMNPSAGLKRAVEKGVPPGDPKWERSYRSWLLSQPDEAREWLSSQKSQWNDSGHQASVASFIAKDLETSGEIRATADVERAGQQLREQVAAWKETDPDAAERWLRSASPAALAALKGGAGE